MSTIVFSDQSSVFYILFLVHTLRRQRDDGNNAETQYVLSHDGRKRPTQTTIFLVKLHTALSIFDDQISSLGEEHSTTYETFITGYKEAFTEIWLKIQAADVTVLLSSVKDTELHELRCLSEQLCPDKAKPTLLKEKRDVPSSNKFWEV